MGGSMRPTRSSPERPAIRRPRESDFESRSLPPDCRRRRTFLPILCGPLPPKAVKLCRMRLEGRCFARLPVWTRLPGRTRSAETSPTRAIAADTSRFPDLGGSRPPVYAHSNAGVDPRPHSVSKWVGFEPKLEGPKIIVSSESKLLSREPVLTSATHALRFQMAGPDQTDPLRSTCLQNRGRGPLDCGSAGRNQGLTL